MSEGNHNGNFSRRSPVYIRHRIGNTQEREKIVKDLGDDSGLEERNEGEWPPVTCTKPYIETKVAINLPDILCTQ